MKTGDPVDVDVIERHWTSLWDIERRDSFEDESVGDKLIVDVANIVGELIADTKHIGKELTRVDENIGAGLIADDDIDGGLIADEDIDDECITDDE